MTLGWILQPATPYSCSFNCFFSGSWNTWFKDLQKTRGKKWVYCRFTQSTVGRDCKYPCSEDLFLSSLFQKMLRFCFALSLSGSNSHSGHTILVWMVSCLLYKHALWPPCLAPPMSLLCSKLQPARFFHPRSFRAFHLLYQKKEAKSVDPHSLQNNRFCLAAFQLLCVQMTIILMN